MIGFIGTSVTVSLDYNRYSVIADLHTFQFTVPHALGFSVSTSRLLATDVTSNHYDVFLSFLLQSPWTADFLNSDLRRRSSLILSPVWSNLDTNTLSSYSLGILFIYIDPARTRITENTSRDRYPLFGWRHRASQKTCHVIATQPVHWPAGCCLARTTQKTRHVTATLCYGVTSLRMRQIRGHKENTAAVLLTACCGRCLAGFTRHSIFTYI
jgi:hypothetical protein